MVIHRKPRCRMRTLQGSSWHRLNISMCKKGNSFFNHIKTCEQMVFVTKWHKIDWHFPFSSCWKKCVESHDVNAYMSQKSSPKLESQGNNVDKNMLQSNNQHTHTHKFCWHNTKKGDYKLQMPFHLSASCHQQPLMFGAGQQIARWMVSVTVLSNHVTQTSSHQQIQG